MMLVNSVRLQKTAREDDKVHSEHASQLGTSEVRPGYNYWSSFTLQSTGHSEHTPLFQPANRCRLLKKREPYIIGAYVEMRVNDILARYGFDDHRH